ncbi:50S ribosomal protein L10 [Candidatus Pacearchaeota archaeon]|jgi:large subunit ribosomal protein L10|nr:50S ribosomal protein L10 [Candidatus Pacearchaeota archaeon]
MTDKKVTHVSEEKKKVVKELTNLIKTKKTILLASIKNIPASQLQEMVKKLRGKAVVKVPKKNLMFKAIDDSKDEAVKGIKEKINDNVAVLFSEMDCFELAAELVNNKSPAKAKAGQEAPEDIEIPAGPTELIPGPAISELGAVGILIQIDKGKIAIKQAKVVAKKGEKISGPVADILSKLDIKPFTISLVPIAGFDADEKKVYMNIQIDREGTIEKLKNAFGKSLPFAVDIGYTSKDTISYLLQKAGRYANKINRIMTGEPEPVAVVEIKHEEKKIEKEEPKVDAGAGLGALFG